MRTGERPERGLRRTSLAAARSSSTPPRSNAPPRSPTSASPGDLVIADTREQVADLNAAIRDRRVTTASSTPRSRDVTTAGRTDRSRRPGRHPSQRPRPRRGQPPDLDRHRDRRRRRPAPARPARARPSGSRPTTCASTSSSPTPPPSTAPKARPSTTPTSLIGETTGAASAYVAMTRGRASQHRPPRRRDLDDARQQWIEVFSRDRADLGPAHAPTATPSTPSTATDPLTRGPRPAARVPPLSPPPASLPTAPESALTPAPKPHPKKSGGTADLRVRRFPLRFPPSAYPNPKP